MTNTAHTDNTHLTRLQWSQVDMTVLDFLKTFDKVPHQRLMRKLWRYGVRGSTQSWIEAFLVNYLLSLLRQHLISL